MRHVERMFLVGASLLWFSPMLATYASSENSGRADEIGADAEILFPDQTGELPVCPVLHRTSRGAYYGWSVSGETDVNADGFDDVVAGNPYLGSGGAVLVHSGADASTLYEIGGILPDGRLGWAVAGAADLNGDGHGDFLAAAPWANANGIPQSGCIYAYSGADGSILYTIEGPSAEYWLGHQLAALGDIDGDNKTDFMMGTPKTEVVAVYSGIDGSVLYHKSRDDHFDVDCNYGNAISGADDVDADSVPDFIVGAYGAGTVFVYSGRTGTVIHELNGDPSELFGVGVGGLGDLNKDGHADVAVSAPWADNDTIADAGRVDVYSGETGAMMFSIYGMSGGDRLAAVSGGGDYDGDGCFDVIVGASNASNNTMSGSGMVLIVSGSDGRVLCSQYGENAWDLLGCSVAHVGTGDGSLYGYFAAGARGVGLRAGYALTLGISSCDCTCQGDPACDGVIDVLDVVTAVNVAFRSTIPPDALLCPFPDTDVTCDGLTNVIDVVKFVNVAFRSGEPAVEFCDPCAP